MSKRTFQITDDEFGVSTKITEIYDCSLELLSSTKELFMHLDQKIKTMGKPTDHFEILKIDLYETIIYSYDIIQNVISGAITLVKTNFRPLYERLLRMTFVFYGNEEFKQVYSKFQLTDFWDAEFSKLEGLMKAGNLRTKFLADELLINHENLFKMGSALLHGKIIGSVDNWVPNYNVIFELLRTINGLIQWIVFLIVLHFNQYLPINLTTQHRIMTSIEYVLDSKFELFYVYDDNLSEDENIRSSIQMQGFPPNISLKDLEAKYGTNITLTHFDGKPVIKISEDNKFFDFTPNRFKSINQDKIYQIENIIDLLLCETQSEAREIIEGKEVSEDELLKL